MELHPAEVIIAIQVMQAAAALVLGLLLWHFHREFRHVFLRHWALSVFALTLYLFASAGALGAAVAAPEWPELRLALSALSLGAGYPHVVWMMIGTWEAARQQPIRQTTERALLGAALLVGVGSTLIAPFDPDAAWLRNLVRVELRYLLTGMAFVLAGILLWRAQRGDGLLGARIGAAGFGLYGLQLLHVVGINVAGHAGYGPPFYVSYTGLIDFLCQSVIGLGIVVWLLELQQQRAHRARDRLEYARRHDAGTGLPNREQVLRRLTDFIAAGGDRRVAVISLGMNRFARLNRALGWRRSERIMHRIALRLRESIGDECVLGRVADRDFVILRPTRHDGEALHAWTERLLARLLQPLELETEEIFVSFCAGIAIWPDDGPDAESLLQYSQHALVQSAQIGRDVTLYQHLDDEQFSENESALRFETELRRGLSEGQFELFYQPIVRIEDRRLVGFEALLRWHHPRLGLLTPPRFLDEAASIGVLGALEALTLEQALGQMAAWREQGRTGLSIAINVSARQFQNPELVDMLVDTCRRLDVPLSWLTLEITENTALQDLAAAAERIEALRGLGVRVALDDFGTGYSSLANLVRLPVDRVKLDRDFLDNVPCDRRQAELARAIISLARRLGLEVVAEGVEHPDQLEFLAGTECELVQGFLLERPAPPDQCLPAAEARS